MYKASSHKVLGSAGVRSVLFQMLIFVLLVATLLLMQKKSLFSLYEAGELSRMGIMLNGLILTLFVFGLFRIMMVLMRYAREQEIINQLTENLRDKVTRPASSLPGSALAVVRYEKIRWINQQNAPINQAALAASLNASESSRLTLIRFVNNILILTGVFGTVVSLSIALVGASGILDSPESMSQMSVIIGGMSTALSTTITAIVCYIAYAYFFLRLNDVKIKLLSNIEEVTSLYILPQITYTEQSIVRDVAKLTIALREAADQLQIVEKQFIDAGQGLQNAVASMHGQVNRVDDNMHEIKELVRKGFRLPDEKSES
ncbi:MAG: Unknown protein [uncultured Thiotrichaceae bacterium]|uniref:Uncharacterized protein n=1 Tax=uncultured Thiotrichaceae bacterium TaxID=298394 RepID=A0A6S6UFS9_9GAMM|nr:MAG: Unknown protein [uncultured Thiotrichaceae bacterium]